MVDINLFDDEEEKDSKRDKDWDSSAPKQDSKRGDSFKDDLNLDDLGSPASLGDQTLLDDEDVVPELEDMGSTKGDAGDSVRSDSKKKKTPALTYILLVLMLGLLAVLLYFRVFAKKGGGFQPGKQAKKPSITYQSPDLKQPGSKSGKTLPVSASRDSSRIGGFISGSAAGTMDVAKMIYSDLAKQDQFGAVLLDGDRFYVEYISNVPGSSSQIGKRIVSLLGIKDHKASPEERHLMEGKNTYWGVISGLCAKKTSISSKTESSWKSSDLFIDQVKTLARQNSLPLMDVKKLSRAGATIGGEERFRMRIQCSRTQMMTWLDQLKKIQPSYAIQTLFLVSTDYFDPRMDNVKLVLDISINIG
jgi:hypothetical protein